MGNAGNLDEIFCSIQGEGLYLGYRQVFIRTAGCSTGCIYCDTRRAASAPKRYTLYGKGAEELFDNPADPAAAAAAAEKLFRLYGGVHSASITGGEPMEQPGFVLQLARMLQRAGIPVYLETNGLHPGAILPIIPFLDIVSLDIKQPAICNLGDDIFAGYGQLLRQLEGVGLFCKIVLCGGFLLSEFRESVSMLSSFDRTLPLVIQPAAASEGNGGYEAPDPDSITECYSIAADALDDVRVIPQCHKILGVR